MREGALMHNALSNREDVGRDLVGITRAKIWSAKDTTRIMRHGICGTIRSLQSRNLLTFLPFKLLLTGLTATRIKRCLTCFNASCLKNKAPASLRGRGQAWERINIIQSSQHHVVSVTIAEIEFLNRLVYLATSHAAVAK